MIASHRMTKNANKAKAGYLARLVSDESIEDVSRQWIAARRDKARLEWTVTLREGDIFEARHTFWDQSRNAFISATAWFGRSGNQIVILTRNEAIYNVLHPAEPKAASEVPAVIRAERVVPDWLYLGVCGNKAVQNSRQEPFINLATAHQEDSCDQ